MKKLLIALPLVLIMILSMIPVMADEAVPVTINWYKDAAGNKMITAADVEGQLNTGFTLSVPSKTAQDKALLEAFVMEYVEENVKAPVLKNLKARCDDGYKFTVVVDAVAVPAVPEQSEAVSAKLSEATVEAFETAAATLGVEVTKSTDKAPLAQVKQAAIEALKAAAKEKDAAKRTVELSSDNTIADTDAALPQTIEGIKYTAAKAATDAKVTVKAVPVCDMKEVAPEKCVPACKQITVEIYDVWADEVIKNFSRKFDVNTKLIPDLKAVFDLYVANFFPHNLYRLLPYYNGADWTNMDKMLLGDCTLRINVLPLNVGVNVIHELYQCCKNPITGKMEIDRRPYKVFHEIGQVVDFIDWHTKLVVKPDLAAEFAKTRLEVLSASNFVFMGAVLETGIRPSNYVTGPVYDLNGKQVSWDVAAVDGPAIRLIYHDSHCVETEEKVDNATVDAGNTTNNTPATASAGAQLPATGAKDVTAFFLSAVALLGLGVFFAKKH